MKEYQKISQHTTNAVEHGTVPAHRTDGYNFRAAGVIQSSAATFNRGALARSNKRRMLAASVRDI